MARRERTRMDRAKGGAPCFVSVLLLAGLVAYAAPASSSLPSARSPLPADRGLLADRSFLQADRPDVFEVVVRLGGVRVRALCTPGPTKVLLLHGGASTADAWRPVLERLDGRVGACAYDRRGSGESRPAPDPRGWYELLDELRRIHHALGADTPYILVGHELGGLYATLYAQDRPLDVRGLVLVEPAHGDLPRRMRPGMPADAWDAWVADRGRPNRDGVVERLVAERNDGLRYARIPVTVLTATRRRDGDGWDGRFLDEAARQVHESMVRGLTLGRHVPVEGSGPLVHRDDPRRVADEILRVVEASRTSATRRTPTR